MAMAKIKPTASSNNDKPRRQPISPEAWENQIIADAMDLAEKQIRSGEASSQVITHFLKLGAEREKNRLELEKLREENKLLIAKTEQIQSQKKIEELYADAITAMKSYTGNGDPDEY